MSKLDSALDAVRSGRAPAVASLWIKGWSKSLWEVASHRLLVPHAADLLVGPTSRIYTNTADILHALLPGVDPTETLSEYGEVETELRRRRTIESSAYDTVFDVQAGTASLLYCLVRLNKMQNVWETGVADGVSSFVMLQAMARSASGTLHSTDIRAIAGSLVHPDERSQWDLHLLDRSHPTRSVKSYAETLGELDLFVHDSRHSYRWQTTELEAAAPLLHPGGFVASDDVDSSLAYADFCRVRKLDPQYLFDERKFFGIAHWK